MVIQMTVVREMANPLIIKVRPNNLVFKKRWKHNSPKIQIANVLNRANCSCSNTICNIAYSMKGKKPNTGFNIYSIYLFLNIYQLIIVYRIISPISCVDQLKLLYQRIKQSMKRYCLENSLNFADFFILLSSMRV